MFKIFILQRKNGIKVSPMYTIENELFENWFSFIKLKTV